jgi:hypothetical protein
MRVQTTLLGNQEAKLQARYVAKGGQKAAAALITHARNLHDPMFENDQVQLFRYTCLTPALGSLDLTADQGSEKKQESEDLNQMEGCGLWSLSLPYMLGETPIQLDIYDEQSRLNLNALVTISPGNTSAQPSMNTSENMIFVVFELFRYEVFKHDLAIADADLMTMVLCLKGYIDNGIVDGEADKDEVSYFEDGDRTIPMKDGPLDTVDEIRYLPGMTDELFDAVKDFLTVYPASETAGQVSLFPQFDARVNLNTAPVEVIYALIRGTSYLKGAPSITEEEAMKYAIQIVQEAYAGGATAPGAGVTQASSGLPRYLRSLPAGFPATTALNTLASTTDLPPPRFYRIKSTALTTNGFDTTIIKVVKDQNGVLTTLYFKEE